MPARIQAIDFEVDGLYPWGCEVTSLPRLPPLHQDEIHCDELSGLSFSCPILRRTGFGAESFSLPMARSLVIRSTTPFLFIRAIYLHFLRSSSSSQTFIVCLVACLLSLLITCDELTVCWYLLYLISFTLIGIKCSYEDYLRYFG